MALVLEEVADVAAGFAGNHEAEPGRIRAGARCGNDLDGFALEP